MPTSASWAWMVSAARFGLVSGREVELQGQGFAVFFKNVIAIGVLVTQAGEQFHGLFGVVGVGSFPRIHSAISL